ncbi:hypothetical protein M407DRAFT_25880 [Tulasnella calospora MUT 4182]|uniref:DUF6533 domain-containing protein n=1 Tax=Tulasnella calospora MUT 4182 TaxID=1051891 RepID=A0A0C3Q654_9AGAM|nr:hypothetical protein M407DRAFT_25880 [Tulasnella calospora MUT 4182]
MVLPLLPPPPPLPPPPCDGLPPPPPGGPMDALGFFRMLAYQSAVTRYCMVAGYMWVLYDWLITLDQEIDLVWVGDFIGN